MKFLVDFCALLGLESGAFEIKIFNEFILFLIDLVGERQMTKLFLFYDAIYAQGLTFFLTLPC